MRHLSRRAVANVLPVALALFTISGLCWVLLPHLAQAGGHVGATRFTTQARLQRFSRRLSGQGAAGMGKPTARIRGRDGHDHVPDGVE